MSAERVLWQVIHIGLMVAWLLLHLVVQSACAADAEAAAAAFSIKNALVTDGQGATTAPTRMGTSIGGAGVEASAVPVVLAAIRDEDEEAPARSRNYPRRRRGEIEFRYEDRGYDDVFLIGSFNGWNGQPMELDDSRGIWTIRVHLPEGKHDYQFVVRQRGETWEVIDPSNPDGRRRGSHGWVSVLRVDDGGYTDRSKRKRRRVERDWTRDEFFPVMYQRVDGLWFGIAPSWKSRGYDFKPSVFSMIGYGFSSKRWSGNLEIIQPLTSNRVLNIMGAAYSKTDFTFQTGVGALENTLAAGFFADDYRDYYRREGLTFGLILDADFVRVEGGYHNDTYESMVTEQNGSWGKGDLPANPQIDDGEIRSFYGQLRVGRPFNYLQFDYETTGSVDPDSQFDFTQMTGVARARIPFGRFAHIDLRLRAGTALDGVLPVQKQYVVGGLGTVRGQAYQSLLTPDPDRDPTAPKPLGGQKMGIFNADYVIHLSGDFGLSLFFDGGMAWENKDADMSFDQWKSGFGLGILLFDDGDDGLRINIAKPTDKAVDPIWQLRINRMF